MLGWRGMSLSRKKTSIHFDAHCITIPIHVGGLIPVTEKAGFAIFFGPRIDIPVSAKIEQGNNSQKADHSVGITLDFGIDLKYSDWGSIRIQYNLGLGGDKSVSKNINAVSIGLNYGF